MVSVLPLQVNSPLINSIGKSCVTVMIEPSLVAVNSIALSDASKVTVGEVSVSVTVAATEPLAMPEIFPSESVVSCAVLSAV